MNFDFFKNNNDFKQLYKYCIDAEKMCLSNPNISVASSGMANEYVIKFLYASLINPFEKITVYEMLVNLEFKQALEYNKTLFDAFHKIRILRNEVQHNGKNCDLSESLEVLKCLVYEVQYLFKSLELLDDFHPFIDPSMSSEKKDDISINTDEENYTKVEDKIIAKYSEKLKYTIFSKEADRDEAHNKKRFFEASLTEARWPIVNVVNESLPSSAGINMLLDDGDTCDYVLYGKNNKPLAVIQYINNNESLLDGRKKGLEKAKKLSVKTGYMPVVYYTNGYMIYCIDGLGFPPRRVFNFHSVDELEVLVQRQSTRKDISNPIIDHNIVGRPYQDLALQAICKAYASNRRKSLLVLATGTGKTRVSIALTDILMKANWVKNVLFLADRTALVRQAHKNYTQLLPNVSTSVYTGGSLDKDSKARIIFSTYQSMINLIEGDTKEFGIGRFDIIIIDEAHRSIFKKYKAIFDYFDAMMLGLTATPRSEQTKSTYEVFELPKNTPDYAYELTEAVKDNYLTPFAVIDKTTKLLKRGKKYSDLTQEEKDQLEEEFGEDNDLLKKFISKNELDLGRKTVNIPTINAMLNDLMKNGIKIDNGDKIGKTIIFAKSHIEAQVIVDQFNKLHPELGYDFCKLIDSQVDNGLLLIDKFSLRESLPQIVVSVDMLDTGIDVPDILNLVFFKAVKSKIKFLQMIGRGTRLSADIFGPGDDKKGFVIFDYYDNFNYFEEKEIKPYFTNKIVAPSVAINSRKLNILQRLEFEKTLNSFDKKYLEDLKAFFVNSVNSLINDDVEVEYNMPYVNKYRTNGIFDELTDKKVEEIKKIILPLFSPLKGDVKTKSFDHSMYIIEDEVSEGLKCGYAISTLEVELQDVIANIDKKMEELSKLKTIPQVVAKQKEIADMRDCRVIFDNFSLEISEYYRNGLRDLMSFLPDKSDFLITNFDDYIDKKSTDTDVVKVKPYFEKVKDYLEDSSKIVLAKIRNLDEITKEEQEELVKLFTIEYGTESDFKKLSNGKELLPYIRMQVGIANEAITSKFGAFLNNKVLSQVQLNICNQIIEYAKANGDITAKVLLNVAPFDSMDISSIFGSNITHLRSLISGLHKPVEMKK